MGGYGQQDLRGAALENICGSCGEGVERFSFHAPRNHFAVICIAVAFFLSTFPWIMPRCHVHAKLQFCPPPGTPQGALAWAPFGRWRQLLAGVECTETLFGR